MVDVELTIKTVQGIHIYCKDHTAEPTIFTPWSKSVTPFPSLRKKIKAFKEDSRGHLTPAWMPLVNTLTKSPRNPKKCTSGKVRTRWSNRNHRFNLIKTSWVNTLGTDSMNENKISILKFIPQKACKQFGATCSFCRQQVPHPLPNQSNWSSKDWDRDKTKAKEQSSIVKFHILWPKMDNPTMDPVDSIPFEKLMIQTDGPDKKALEVSTTLIPLPEQGAVEIAITDSQTKLDIVPKEEEEQAAQELRMWIEEEKYRLYLGQLSPEESEIDMETDGSNYPYLD